MPSGWFPLYYFPDHCSDLLHALIYCWFPLVYFSFQLLYSSLLIFKKYFIPLADTLSSSIPLSCSLNILGRRLKHLPAMWETRVRPLGWEDPLEKEMATHSSILAWKIPWTEEPGGLYSMGWQRVGHDWVTSLHYFEHFMLKIAYLHFVQSLFWVLSWFFICKVFLCLLILPKSLFCFSVLGKLAIFLSIGKKRP